MHLLSTNRLTSLLYSPWLCYPWALPPANSPLHPPLSSEYLCMCSCVICFVPWFFSLVFFLFLGFFLLHTWVESIGVSLLLICLQTCKEQSWYMTWIGQESLNKVTWPWSSNKSAMKGNSTTDPQPPPRLHLLQWTESSSHHYEHLRTDGRYPVGFQDVCSYLAFSVPPRETRHR